MHQLYGKKEANVLFSCLQWEGTAQLQNGHDLAFFTYPTRIEECSGPIKDHVSHASILTVFKKWSQNTHKKKQNENRFNKISLIQLRFISQVWSIRSWKWRLDTGIKNYSLWKLFFLKFHHKGIKVKMIGWDRLS